METMQNYHEFLLPFKIRHEISEYLKRLFLFHVGLILGSKILLTTYIINVSLGQGDIKSRAMNSRQHKSKAT